MEEVPSEKQDERWRQRLGDINRCVLDVYSKEAGKRDASDGDAANRRGQLAPEPDASCTKTLDSPIVRDLMVLLPGRQTLRVGSDVEIAQCIAQDFAQIAGLVVHAEGSFWYHTGTHWQAIADNELRKTVHAYDGAEVVGAVREARSVKLGKSRINSILNELGALCARGNFFSQTPPGINCLSGFIRFSPVGTPTLEPHNPDHRCRHVLPGRWKDGHFHGVPPGSLLSRLLRGSFASDEDEQQKIDVLAEVLAAAALGTATRLRQPRAVILKGETAENGKSQILDLARGLLPPSAIASVTIGRMGDERHIVGLVGKLLNACDEISSSAAIASNTFKAIVTGEPVEGRDVYKSRTDFRATAQHLFATNTLPAFQDGMDRGVRRRLMIIIFNRVIPLEERIEQIGRRIGTEETDQLLAWVVDGGSRLIRNGSFSVPSASKEALYDWIYGSDPVLAWIDACVDQHSGSDEPIATRSVFQAFRTWAVAEGFDQKQLPYINGFTQRVLAGATWVAHRRTSHSRFFVGLRIRTAGNA